MPIQISNVAPQQHPAFAYRSHLNSTTQAGVEPQSTAPELLIPIASGLIATEENQRRSAQLTRSNPSKSGISASPSQWVEPGVKS